MNIKQIQYVHHVSKCGSMHKASKELFISQPNLTNTISSLEDELGVTLFKRTNKGVELTSDGYDFLSNTQPVLRQMEYLENLYENKTNATSKSFNVSCQRFEFILNSFLTLEKQYKDSGVKFSYRETCCNDVIENVMSNQSDVGIVMFSNHRERFFNKMFEAKDLDFGYINVPETVNLLVSNSHPLSNRDFVTVEDFKEYKFVTFGDEFLYNINYLIEYNILGIDVIDRFIQVFDRASLNNILSNTDYVSIGVKALKNSGNLVSIPIKSLDVKFKFTWIRKKSTMALKIHDELIDILQNYPW